MAVIAVHGGAGGGDQPQVDGVAAALRAGLAVIGISALDAVCAAVEHMESSGLFNAGRGAVRTSADDVELDAAVMTGHDSAAGAIAASRIARNPIVVARALHRLTTPVLLVGEGADAYIREEGLPTAPPDWFVRAAASSRFGTVGAVALDDEGNYAVATSTGGVRGQRPGRVGDTPLIGAGTFADERCAVSATGDGEVFIRTVFAHAVAAAAARGDSITEATRAALARVAGLGGTGGCVAIGPHGDVSLDHNTDVMPAGWARTDGATHVALRHA